MVGTGATRDTEITLTILGSGTSTGVPLINCGCRVCRSRDPRDHRLRCAAWVRLPRTRPDNRLGAWTGAGKSMDRVAQASNLAKREPGETSLLIDASPDLRLQALRAKIRWVDGVLFTHPHADHVHGIDELRSFNFNQGTRLPVYAHEWTESELFSKFPYIFRRPAGTAAGGGLPELEISRIPTNCRKIQAGGAELEVLWLKHGSRDSLGFRFDSVAYVTDCSYIPPDSLSRLQGLAALVLDCVRIEPHDTHLNLERALELVRQVRPKRTFLTHLGHDFGHRSWKRKLPPGVALAYDGLEIKVRSS